MWVVFLMRYHTRTFFTCDTFVYECIIFDDGMAVLIPLQKYKIFVIFHFMVMQAFDNSFYYYMYPGRTLNSKRHESGMSTL